MSLSEENYQPVSLELATLISVKRRLVNGNVDCLLNSICNTLNGKFCHNYDEFVWKFLIDFL